MGCLSGPRNDDGRNEYPAALLSTDLWAGARAYSDNLDEDGAAELGDETRNRSKPFFH
jgi:hypothetical protein